MIPIVKADGTVELEFIRQLKKRSGEVDEKVNQAVAQIIAQVKERGDEAVREYTVKFDGRAPENLEISKKELKEAENSRAPELLDALRRAAENIADFHRRQVQQSWLETKKDGVILGQRIRGLQRVGLYVPGGTAAYPSSVLMNDYSGENRRGAGIDNGDSPRKGRKAEPGYFGGGIHCRRRPGVSDGRRSGCGGPGFRYPAGAQGR